MKLRSGQMQTMVDASLFMVKKILSLLLCVQFIGILKNSTLEMTFYSHLQYVIESIDVLKK